jgi:hypothetical protein
VRRDIGGFGSPIGWPRVSTKVAVRDSKAGNVLATVPDRLTPTQGS